MSNGLYYLVLIYELGENSEFSYESIQKTICKRTKFD